MDFIQRNMRSGEVEREPEAVVQVDRSGQTAVMHGSASAAEESNPDVERAERAGIMGERWEDQEQRPAGEAPERPAKRVPKVAIGSRYVPPEPGEVGARPRASRVITREAIAAAQANGEEKSAGAHEPPNVSPQAPLPPGTELGRVEGLLEQIFLELRRQQEQRDQDFSVSKLLAGVTQVIALAVLFLGYIKGRGPDSATTLHTYLLVAIAMQTLTIALLIMSRQR
jgi:hypothetical protein